MLKVVHPFTDLKDNRHIYHSEDTYPRDGYKPNKKRTQMLIDKGFIEVVDDDRADLQRAE